MQALWGQSRGQIIDRNSVIQLISGGLCPQLVSDLWHDQLVFCLTDQDTNTASSNMLSGAPSRHRIPVYGHASYNIQLGGMRMALYNHNACISKCIPI